MAKDHYRFVNRSYRIWQKFLKELDRKWCFQKSKILKPVLCTHDADDDESDINVGTSFWFCISHLDAMGFPEAWVK